MQSYWQNLNNREQFMVIGAFILILLYSVYWGLFRTLNNTIHTKLVMLNEKATTLAWMQKTAKQSSTQRSVQSLTISQILTTLSTSLVNAELDSFSHQLQQTSQGEIQITFAAVPYLKFIRWLWYFNNQYSIEIKHLNLETAEAIAVGLVKVTMVISANNK